RRHTRFSRDWSSDVCSSDLITRADQNVGALLSIRDKELYQSAYRLFNNTNTTDVGTPLAAQDTAGTLASAGAAFRLRMLVHVAYNNLVISGETFKLQYVDPGTGT